jgi:GNAT superfamily N-acetyltransferase
MHCREARIEDAEQACHVVRRSITELCHADHRGDARTLALWLANKTPEEMRRWIDEHHAFVASEGAAILGVGIIKSSGETMLNYLSPDARFLGISKTLVGRLEARARELGVETVSLQSSTTALRFYSSAGYKALGPSTKGIGVTLCHPMANGLKTGDGVRVRPSRLTRRIAGVIPVAGRSRYAPAAYRVPHSRRERLYNTPENRMWESAHPALRGVGVANTPPRPNKPRASANPVCPTGRRSDRG